jgi:hypothetical protein
MKIWIETEETYPDYTITTKEHGRYEIDAPDSSITRWKVAALLYTQAQSEIAEFCESLERERDHARFEKQFMQSKE